MPKKTGAKKTGSGSDLIEGIKAIRRRVKVSQAEFARAYGIGKRALQEWEQGGWQQDSAARAYLTVIVKKSAEVRRPLAGE